MAEKENELEHSTYFASFFCHTLEKLTELQESAQDLYKCTKRIFFEHESFFDKAEQSMHEYVRMQRSLFSLTLGHYTAYLDSIAAQFTRKQEDTRVQFVRDAANYATAMRGQVFDSAAHQDHGLAHINENQTDHSRMPFLQPADAFEHGVDVILEAPEDFLSALVNPSESTKIKTFGAARK